MLRERYMGARSRARLSPSFWDCLLKDLSKGTTLYIFYNQKTLTIILSKNMKIQNEKGSLSALQFSYEKRVMSK